MRVLRELTRRRLRTTLTILGITIGIWALVVFSAMANQINGFVDSGANYYIGKVIVTDASAPLAIRYVRQEEDATRFDPCFVEVLVARMAAELAEPLTQSLQKKQMALSEYRDAIREARRINAIEGPTQTAPDDAWIMGRL